jgi:2-polyprenyl-6-methoxyphenol hydroxylase-like FAD-dependent oxidoreductase
LVAGGGIGGLMAALFLRRKGMVLTWHHAGEE